jgi:hypothetical protein
MSGELDGYLVAPGPVASSNLGDLVTCEAFDTILRAQPHASEPVRRPDRTQSRRCDLGV